MCPSYCAPAASLPKFVGPIEIKSVPQPARLGGLQISGLARSTIALALFLKKLTSRQETDSSAHVLTNTLKKLTSRQETDSSSHVLTNTLKKLTFRQETNSSAHLFTNTRVLLCFNEFSGVVPSCFTFYRHTS